MELPQLLSHTALTRQWLHCHSESCHKCQTEASGYLLPVPERPDLESEKHITNQTIEIGINYFICSFIRKYTENNFLFHLSNLRKLLRTVISISFSDSFSLMRFPTAPNSPFSKYASLALASSLKSTIFVCSKGLSTDCSTNYFFSQSSNDCNLKSTLPPPLIKADKFSLVLSVVEGWKDLH